MSAHRLTAMPSTPRRGPRLPRSQSGMTMLEAMIAGVVLAIGILGIVSLLLLSKTSQHAAIERTRAVALADDMLERIRRNPGGMAIYSAADLDSPVGGDSLGDEPEPSCTAALCSENELATHDLWAWEELLDTSFGSLDEDGDVISSMRGCVVFTADAGAGKSNTGTVNIILQWQGLEDSTDAVGAGDVCGADWDEADEDYRRQVVMSSYIVDEIEL